MTKLVIKDIENPLPFTEITDEEAAAINGGSIFYSEPYDIVNPDGTYGGTITPGDPVLGTFPVFSGGFLALL